jgi:hypothetical protein
MFAIECVKKEALKQEMDDRLPIQSSSTFTTKA